MEAPESQTPAAHKPTEKADSSLIADIRVKSQKSKTKRDPKDGTSPANTAEDKQVEVTQKATGTPTKVATNQADAGSTVPLSTKTPPAEAPPTANSSDPPPYRPRDTYIAIIGETGVGKTTFIKDVTGLDLEVGDDLDSCTQVVGEFEATINGRVVKFMDTPGFNDSRRTDSEILEVIGTHLREAHANSIHLTAVIYLQWIHETRMRDSAIRNLRILKHLCGKEYYGNIVLVTSGWATPPKQVHISYETQLRTRDAFWGEFIKIGATFQRHTAGKESALEIVNHALGKTPSVLQFQRELAKVGIIGKTTVGEKLILEIAKQRDEDKARIESLAAQLKGAEQQNRGLEETIAELKDGVASMATQIKNLETKLDERINHDEQLHELVESEPRNARFMPRCAVQ